jgi:hypothetical protein
LKTILRFDEGYKEGSFKRKAILRHSKDVRITREKRKNHLVWTDHNDQIIKDADYIVIRYPDTMKIDLSLFDIRGDRYGAIGFCVNKIAGEIEVLLYDQPTFTWHAYGLSKTGIFHYTQRTVPNFKATGELFSYYMNPEGFWQVGYDLILGILNIPFTNYREKKNKRLKENKVLEAKV